MSLPITRYALDKTGTNRDNLVAGEIHDLSSRAIRALAPKYGAFFTNSIEIWDNVSNTPLVPDVDFSCVELLEDATLVFGSELCYIVLIKNQNISSQVRINYQVLGGHYQNVVEGIVNMYELAMLDNRPVDWINVLNKPEEFPPSIHKHLLDDVVGFEPVVVALERIRNAIEVSNIPTYEALLDYINRQFQIYWAHIHDFNNPHQTTAFQVGLGLVENLPVVTPEEIEANYPVHKYVTHDRLMDAVARIWMDGICRIKYAPGNLGEGYTLAATVMTANIDDNTVLYWNVVNVTSSNDDFTQTSGSFSVYRGEGGFYVTIHPDVQLEFDEIFRLEVRKNSPTGKLMATTPNITIHDIRPRPHGTDDYVLPFLAEYVFNRPGPVTAKSMFIINSNSL